MSKPPRSQKALLAALVFALLAVVGFAAMQDRGGPSLAEPDDDRGTLRGGDVGVADGALPRDGASEARDASASSGSGAGARDAALGDDFGSGRPLPENARWVELLVVDKATGTPQPDALVHWYDDSAHEFVLRDDDDGWDLATQALFQVVERVAGVAGWRTRTDGDGKARVTLGKQWTNVAVTHGALYGKLDLRDNSVPPAGGWRVELAPDVAMTVRVVDEKGAPCADVPIALVALAKGTDDEVLARGDTPLAHTDADGKAVLPHLQLACAAAIEMPPWAWGGWGRRQAGDAPAPTPQWHVRPLLVGSRDAGVAFDPAAPPAEAIELRLPPTGALRVRAEAAGRPVANFTAAYASRAEDENDGHALDVGLEQKADAAGVARFARVVLGARFDVYSGADGGMHGTFAGPSHAGHEVDVVLQPQGDVVMLSGRLLTAERQPARHTRVSVRAVGEDIWMHETTKTDGDGRFVVNLGRADEPQVAQKLWIDTIVKDAAPQRAEIAGRALRNGREEVGDVVLGDAPLLVGGVVTADGKPYADAVQLNLERFQPPADGARDGEWQWIDGQYAHKGKDGRFVVRGVPEPGRYRLQVGAERALPHEPVEFRLGADDVAIELKLGAPLAASALLPEKTPQHQLRFTLAPDQPPAKKAATGAGEDPQDWLFQGNLEGGEKGRADVRWHTLPPGNYTLRVELWAQRRELLAIPNIAVPAPATPDPRLVDIDLRAALRVVELTVRGADGQPLDECYGVAFPQTSAGAAEWRGESFWQDSTQLLLPPGPYELLVCVRGHRPLPVRGDTDKVVARVEPWARVLVRVPGVPKLPAETWVRAWLRGPKGTGERYATSWGDGDRSELLQSDASAETVAKGVARLPISDGAHTLHLGVYNEHGGAEIALPAPVTILPSQTETTVSLPEAVWQQAIANLPKPEGGETPALRKR